MWLWGELNHVNSSAECPARASVVEVLVITVSLKPWVCQPPLDIEESEIQKGEKKLPTRGQLRIKTWIFRPPILISFLCPIYILTRSCKAVAHRLNILFAFFIASFWDFPVTQTVKNLPAMEETWVWSQGWEDPLAKGMAIHSSILAWRIP